MLISIKPSGNSAFFPGSDKPIMLFFLLLILQMPTIVGIITFMSRKISCIAELSMNFIYYFGASLWTMLYHVNMVHVLPGHLQYIFNGSNTDCSFITAISNSFLSLLEKFHICRFRLIKGDFLLF